MILGNRNDYWNYYWNSEEVDSKQLPASPFYFYSAINFCSNYAFCAENFKNV